jgi:hypothetical protein
MLLFLERSGAAPDERPRQTDLKKFADELERQGKLPRGVSVDTAAAITCVRAHPDGVEIKDRASTERAQSTSGFWIVDVADRAEAIEIARRSPHARYGIVEVHPMLRRYAFSDPGTGIPYLFSFNREPGLCDPDGAKLREMVGFAEELHAQGQLLETAPLAAAPPPARVETRGGTLLVTDGPFAEAKEGVGGYSLVRAASRTQAIAIAERYPHARWGLVEVREALSFNPV